MDRVSRVSVSSMDIRMSLIRHVVTGKGIHMYTLTLTICNGCNKKADLVANQRKSVRFVES